MQGDPIAIGLYALGITPLMTAVTSPSESMHIQLATHFTKSLWHMILWFVEN